jgi:hypothetical protein
MAVGDKHFPGDAPLIHSGRYLDDDALTDGTASFIDFDTEVNVAPFTLDLRDADHAEGMHYWIRVTGNSTGTLTVQRPTAGSTKTISGRFVGQTLSAATSVVLAASDGVMRIKPDGDNWIIY